jgi:hypothetical protein
MPLRHAIIDIDYIIDIDIAIIDTHIITPLLITPH